MYQILTRELVDEVSDINACALPKYSNAKDFLQHKRKQFEAYCNELRSQGIAYDPRNTLSRIPAGEAGALASKARDMWVELRELEALGNGFLDDEMRMDRNKLMPRIEGVTAAWRLHRAFMTQVRRHALRWRITGKTILFGVRWIRKAFGRPGLRRVIVRGALRWQILGLTMLFGMRWVRKTKKGEIVA